MGVEVEVDSSICASFRWSVRCASRAGAISKRALSQSPGACGGSNWVGIDGEMDCDYDSATALPLNLPNGVQDLLDSTRPGLGEDKAGRGEVGPGE